MKLLFDQNLSRRILPKINEFFADSTHVVHLDMDRENDIVIWDYAKKHDYIIITKDKDFLQRSVLMGHPPKVIHIALGNCGVETIAALILTKVSQIKAFAKHRSKSYLLLPN